MPRRPLWMRGACAIGLLCGCLTIAQSAAAQSVPSTPETQEPGTFWLTATDGYLSIEAKDASVAAIFTELGRQTGIGVDIYIDLEEMLTIQLEQVPLEDAIKQLAENVAIFYTKGAAEPTSRITKVGVYSPGQAGPNPLLQSLGEPADSQTQHSQPEQAKSAENRPTPRSPVPKEESPRPAPFQFTFDPMKSLKKPR